MIHRYIERSTYVYPIIQSISRISKYPVRCMPVSSHVRQGQPYELSFDRAMLYVVPKYCWVRYTEDAPEGGKKERENHMQLIRSDSLAPCCPLGHLPWTISYFKKQPDDLDPTPLVSPYSISILNPSFLKYLHLYRYFFFPCPCRSSTSTTSILVPLIPIMRAGTVIEPLVVIVLLFGGTWINRSVGSSSIRRHSRRSSNDLRRSASFDSLESGYSSQSTKDGLLGSRSHSPQALENGWHKRHVGLPGLNFEVSSPNTIVFRDRLLSRLLRKFPFLVECWYWALVYWVG